MAEKKTRAPLSQEARRKRSIVMKRMATKLMAARKRASMRSASAGTIKKHAHQLARTILRKKVAGAMGGEYAHLSTSQKIAVDRAMLRYPASVVARLAKPLIQVVKKHNIESVKAARAAQNKTNAKKIKTEGNVVYTEEDDISSNITESKSLRTRMYASQRASINTHKVKNKSYIPRTRGESENTKNKAASAASVAFADTRLGRGSSTTKTNMQARQWMRNAMDMFKTNTQNMRDKHKKHHKRAAHSDRSRKGHKGIGKSHKRDNAFLRTASFDYELDGFASMIAEGSMERFEQLFLRGLVPKSKIEIYKRIFDDLEQNIKYRRYHDEITDIMETLIDLITKDNNIYYRVRTRLQQQKMK